MLGGLGVAWLAARTTSHGIVWAVAPFVAATVYLLLESAETALGERVLAASGDQHADDVTP